MTATLAAALVEQGAIGWDTRLVEVFPTLRAAKGWEQVTLEDLERVGSDIADGHEIQFDPEQVAQFAALIEMEGRRTRRGCWLGLVIVVAVVVYFLVR